jgi:phosphoribosyl 1,2-cyclic phosphodiesterase
MSLRVQVLASGSSGNATLYSAGETHVLVDCGLSARRICLLLRKAGVEPEALSGIFITHEHSDHVQGLAQFLKRRKIPLFIAPQCLESDSLRGLAPWHAEPIAPGVPVTLGLLTVTPFPVPHDSSCCLGFALEARGVKAVQATDLGQPTPVVRRHLQGSHCMLLEFNHDLDRLMNGSYPMHIKLRVKSSVGHLSNEQAASLLAGAANGETQALFLMHLSKENNHPALALLAAREVLGGRNLRMEVTQHLAPSPPWEG